MISHGGFWWPEDDTDAHGVILADCEPSIEALLPYVQGRDYIVQAGGNVGVYPMALSKLFKQVLTCEPDRENVRCLWRNLDGLDNIDTRCVALGEDVATCHVVPVGKHNCGAHRVELGGEIGVLPIDSFDVPACDCIWLDIEGFELFALKGATRIIERFHPVIACEEKGLGEVYGVGPEDIGHFLQQFGYARVARIGRDNVYA